MNNEEAIERVSHMERFSHGFASWAGKGQAFMLAIVSLIVWLVIGDHLKYSSKWENLFTCYIGAVTFLMFFLMQRAHNKELLALHVKLDELVASVTEADSALVNVQEKSEKEVVKAHEKHAKIAEEA